MRAITSRDSSPVHRRRWRMLGLLAVAQFMLILDVTVVAIALPDMAGQLGLDRSAITWVVSAYTLTFGGMLLLGGRSADLLGSKLVIQSGLILFTAASLVTGLAGNSTILLAGRVAQGMGAALLSPAALSMVVKTFHGDERNRALGLWSALGGSGAAVGVLLGGLLTAGPGWKWVFYINVPIGVLMTVLLTRIMPADRPSKRPGQIDVLGALLVTTATAAAVWGLIRAGESGLASSRTLLPLTIAGLLYCGFVVRQRRTAHPLMNLRVFTRRPVAAGAILILVATALMISVFFLGTFYLQHYRGHGPLVTGLLFLPVAGGTMVGAQVAGRRVGACGPRPVVLSGLFAAAIGAGIPALLDSTAATVIGMSVAALGIGALFVAASTLSLGQVAPGEAGLASGILSTFHEFGAAFGVAATSSLAASSVTGATDQGFVTAFAGVAVTGLVMALIAAFAVRPSARNKPAVGVNAGA